MRHLILVKHSLPELVAQRPRREWHLSEEGLARCGPLASRLAPFRVERVSASPEPKAQETALAFARTIGAPAVEMVDGLREQDDDGVPFAGQAAFRAAVAEFFLRPSEAVFGQEIADAAHARFSATIRALPEPNDGAAHVVVSHGRVISLFVARHNDLDPYALWTQLGLPLFIVLECPEYRIVDVVGTL